MSDLVLERPLRTGGERETRGLLKVCIVLPDAIDSDGAASALIGELQSIRFVGKLSVFQLPGTAMKPFIASPSWWAYQRLESRASGPPQDRSGAAAAARALLIDEVSVRSAEWDVLLCPHFDPRLGDFAQYASHGVWWVSADSARGRTPDARCQLGAMLEDSGPTHLSLWRQVDSTTGPELLDLASVRLVSGFSLKKNLAVLEPLRQYLWTAALCRLHKQGRIDPRSPEPAPADAAPVRFAGPALARMAVQQLRRRKRQKGRQEAWQVGVRPERSAGGAFHDPAGYRWLNAPENCWLADPCPIVIAGQTWLFMEKYDATRGLGEICCCTLTEDGVPGPLLEVLRRPYHLSYPHIFCEGGDVFMIPETGGHETVELYRAVDFPQKWELVRVLHKAPAFDTTVLKHRDRFWFFTSIASDPERVASQLLLFEADRPDGDWRPHPASPLSMDSRWSRSAGRIWVQDGRMIRPAQDCSRIYGGAISFREIELLNEREYRERPLAVLTPEVWKDDGAIGVHTYDRAGHIEVIDRLLCWR